MIRKSGTEPVIRVMAEGEDEELVAAVVDEICEAILRAAADTEETRASGRAAGFGPGGGIVRRMHGRVLIIAGSDSGGGAGIQADIKTVSMLDAYAATAITALTAQNTEGVFGVLPIPPDFVRRQIEVVLDDIGADAIKTGMLHDLPVIETIAAALQERAAGIPLVVDPVMVAKGGARLIDPAALDGLKRLLIARAEILDAEFAGSRNSVRHYDRQHRRDARRRPKPAGARLPVGACQGWASPRARSRTYSYRDQGAAGRGRARGSRPAIPMGPAARSPRRSLRAWPKA